MRRTRCLLLLFLRRTKCILYSGHPLIRFHQDFGWWSSLLVPDGMLLPSSSCFYYSDFIKSSTFLPHRYRNSRCSISNSFVSFDFLSSVSRNLSVTLTKRSDVVSVRTETSLVLFSWLTKIHHPFRSCRNVPVCPDFQHLAGYCL